MQARGPTRNLPQSQSSVSGNLQNLPKYITLSENELSSGMLNTNTLKSALLGLYNDGLVVITNAVPHDSLDRLNAIMVPEALTIAKSAMENDFNFGRSTGNIQQSPPLNGDSLDKMIIANPFVEEITKHYLGPSSVLRFYSANTALGPMKPNGRQPVHTDCNFETLNIPFSVVVNTTLIETSPQNGATEVWLGTHTSSSFSDQDERGGYYSILPESIKARSQLVPAIQPSLPKGSIVIRDMRLWHAGRPNMTTEPRVMIAMVYTASWYGNRLRITLENNAHEKIDKWFSGDNGGFKAAVNWQNEVNHLNEKYRRPDTDFSENGVS